MANIVFDNVVAEHTSTNRLSVPCTAQIREADAALAFLVCVVECFIPKLGHAKESQKTLQAFFHR